MLIGIDSSGGHIASFYNIPSITIWGKQTPECFPETLKKVSFRPLKKNISIWSERKCTDVIDANIIFEKAMEILNGNIKFSDDMIKIQ